MKNMSKLLAAGLALSMAVSLGACAAYPEIKDTASMLKMAETKLKKITSAESTITTTFNLKKNGGKYEQLTTDKLSANVAEPMTFRDQKTVQVNGRKHSEADYIAIEGKEKKVSVYQYDGQAWTVADYSREDVLALNSKADPMGSLQILIDKAEKFSVVGQDTIGGLNVTVVEAKFTGGDVKSILQYSGGEAAIQSLFSFNMKEADSKEAYEKLLASGYETLSEDDGVTVRAYISEAMLYPLRINIDGGNVINKMVKTMLGANTMGSESVKKTVVGNTTVLEFKVRIDMRNFNRAAAIKLPSGAEKAETVEAELVETAPPASANPSAAPEASMDAGLEDPGSAAGEANQAE